MRRLLSTGSPQPSACSVSWFVSLLVGLCEREVLLTGSDEQYFYEEAGQPSSSQPAQRTRYDRWKRLREELAVGCIYVRDCGCGEMPACTCRAAGAVVRPV